MPPVGIDGIDGALESKDAGLCIGTKLGGVVSEGKGKVPRGICHWPPKRSVDMMLSKRSWLSGHMRSKSNSAFECNMSDAAGCSASIDSDPWAAEEPKKTEPASSLTP